MLTDAALAMYDTEYLRRWVTDAFKYAEYLHYDGSPMRSNMPSIYDDGLTDVALGMNDDGYVRRCLRMRHWV